MRTDYRFLLYLVALLISVATAGAQTDTMINGQEFKIIDRHRNGAVKQVGQFGTGCRGRKTRKHGTFIYYNRSGNEIRRKVYFFDSRRFRRVLGLKHGWWGFYGLTTQYFFGVKRQALIIDPCF